jgi:NTP pyrophosphatase (non-canonical NTP hydrolase)
MPDTETTLMALRQIVRQFVDEREWRPFHAPKNLAMSLAIEAAELMEHFQWLTVEQSRAVVEDQEKLAAVADELADVLCYVLAMANQLQLDLSTAVGEKIAKNARKYPVSEYRGRFGPDDPKRAGGGG